jgi:GntR family transcriptional repressor for pyruvate dehydrogenase complex
MSAPALPPRVARAVRVAGELEREILADTYEPGERLGTKEELRERFGVAVATVTEALRLLETRGLTEARPGPGGGIFVAGRIRRLALMHNVLGLESDAGAYRDCLAVRDTLEPLVCRDAAHNRRAQDVRDLELIVERMQEHDSDPAGYFTLNWELHRRLAALSPNVPLRTIYMALIEYLETELDHAVYHRFDGAANVAVHRELIAAIAEGSGPRLEAAIAAHAPLPPLD